MSSMTSDGPDSGARFGKYQRTTLLGTGGFGEVWKAWDVELKRWVALKFLKPGDDDEIARFEREARLAAGLSHPGIAAVYEFGESAGRRFIAMQFVDGRTLTSLSRTDRRGIVRAVADAARALAFAHDHGVVHRDVKPENLMIDRQDRVVVMDFGLARPVDTSGLTASGMMVGTPEYMSPEQARAERVDARADIYSLGATLFALLAGRPPFQGSTIYELVTKVVQDEPEIPRDIEPDLAAILRTCLEKEPARRYATAHELGDDLERWLRGEAITTKGSTVVSRIGRSLVRRKALALAVTASLVVIAATATIVALAIRGRETATVRTKEALLDEMRSTAGSCLEAALVLRRVGNLAGMKEHGDRCRRICERVIQEMPGLAEPHYWLGRLARAEMRDDVALAEQNRALELDPAYARAKYERVILNSRLWRRAASGSFQKSGVVNRVVPEAVAIQQRMLTDLEEIADGASLSDEEKLCAQAIAKHTRDHDESDQFLDQALAINPDMEEAWEALAEHDERHHDYAGAVRHWGQGIERDRGCITLLEGRGRAHMRRAAQLHKRGEEAQRHMEAAVADFTTILAFDPRRASAWSGRATAFMQLEMPEKAVVDFTEAHRLEPREFRHRAGRSWAYETLASSRRRAGQDAGRELQAALEDLDAAVAEHPSLAEALNFRALYFVHRSGFEAHPGEMISRALADVDAMNRLSKAEIQDRINAATVRIICAKSTKDRAQAIDLLNAAIAETSDVLVKEPRSATARVVRAEALMDLGDHEEIRTDPRPRLLRVIQDLAKAADVLQSGEVWMKLAKAQREFGSAHADRGEDPTKAYEGAVGMFDNAVKIDDAAEGWEERGRTRVTWGQHIEQAGGDPSALYDAAASDFEEALKRDPSSSSAWCARGTLHRNRAILLARKGKDPSAEYEAAVADYGESLRRNPRMVMSLVLRGGVHVNLALIARQRRQDPSDRFKDAIADFDAALAIDPKDMQALLDRGKARMNWGSMAADRPTARERLEAAIADFEALRRLQPDHAEALSMLGGTKVNLGMVVSDEGGDPRPLFKEAVEVFDRALAINDGSAVTWMFKGNALHNLALAMELKGEDPGSNYRKALAAFEEAIRRNPGFKRQCAKLMENCRRYVDEHPEK